jgi:hypothetical protein
MEAKLGFHSTTALLEAPSTFVFPSLLAENVLLEDKRKLCSFWVAVAIWNVTAPPCYPF